VLSSILLIAAALQSVPEANAAFDKAEKDGREGRYSEAQSGYRRIAEKFAVSDAGRRAAQRTTPSAFLGSADVLRHGPSANRVDIVLMGDGYELSHMKSFDKLASDIPPLFERKEPFHEYWSYFNFLRASLVSGENGVDGFGREYDTALDAKTLNTYAGHVGIDATRVRMMLEQIPEHDGLAICFVKNGVAGTGGGGFATIGGRSAETTIHEWGHAFAGLSDEYEEQQAAHTGAVGASPNISSTEDPKRVPWAHWLKAKHPRIGVYEGGAGRLKGAWKPTSTGCAMATQEEFCAVCREAVVLRVYSLVDPIESCLPAADQDALFIQKLSEEPLEIRVKTMEPASHALEARWWIVPTPRPALTPDPASTSSAGFSQRKSVDRRARGALPPIEEPPTKTSLYDADGNHSLLIRPTELEPGVYRVVCRVKDSTLLRGERWPWVLKDDLGLLESERVWWIEVAPR